MLEVFEKLENIKTLNNRGFASILMQHSTPVAESNAGSVATFEVSNVYGLTDRLLAATVRILSLHPYAKAYFECGNIYIVDEESDGVFILDGFEVNNNPTRLSARIVSSIYDISSLDIVREDTKECEIVNGVYSSINNKILAVTGRRTGEYICPLIKAITARGNETIAQVFDANSIYRITLPEKSRLEIRKLNSMVFITANTKIYENIAKYSDVLMYNEDTNKVSVGYLIYTLITNVLIFMDDISNISIDPMKVTQLSTTEGITIGDRVYCLRPDGLYKFIDFTEDDFARKTYLLPGVKNLTTELGEVFVACPEENCYKLQVSKEAVGEGKYVTAINHHDVGDEVAAFEQEQNSLTAKEVSTKGAHQESDLMEAGKTKMEQLDATVSTLCALLKDKEFGQEIESAMLSDIINNFHPTDLTPPEIITSTVNNLVVAYLTAHVKYPINNAIDRVINL